MVPPEHRQPLESLPRRGRTVRPPEVRPPDEVEAVTQQVEPARQLQVGADLQQRRLQVSWLNKILESRE